MHFYPETDWFLDRTLQIFESRKLSITQDIKQELSHILFEIWNDGFLSGMCVAGDEYSLE